MTTQMSMRDRARRDIFVQDPNASFLRRFITFNRRCSAWLERKLPHARTDLYKAYDLVVAGSAARAPKRVIADIGGGRSCSFEHLLKDRALTTIIGVDISAEEMEFNRQIDDMRVADVAKGLPLADGEAGLVVSRTLLEHVSDVDAFIQHSARVLCDGGLSIHLVPCRYAPFAVIARMVPFGIAKWLLHFFRPETSGWVEFDVYYDRCTFSAMRDSMKRAGFKSVEATVSYYQSDYYDAFFPAYVLSVGYELVVKALGLRNLGAYMLVVAQK